MALLGNQGCTQYGDNFDVERRMSPAIPSHVQHAKVLFLCLAHKTQCTRETKRRATQTHLGVVMSKQFDGMFGKALSRTFMASLSNIAPSG